MVVFCVGVVVVGIVDEMGIQVIGEITGDVVEIGEISIGIAVLDGISGGVGDEAEEEESEDLDDSRDF